jgi:hypothetical protein
MCMSLPFEEDQPVFHVRTSSSKPPKLLEVISHVQLEGEHLKALAKYLLGRAKRKRVIQLPEEFRKAC